ncbi:MAG: Tex-like N-terminal domain-containing protein, partial [Baileyella intestinalis]|uniref:Tex-like N-terminal domain-containing protein n=1 Tax=Baileyella intestinalis TaxID=2606709 RepID=UPI002A76422D
MDIKLISEISKELKVPEAAASSTLALLEEGNTVPFIARYRKEATGGMDEEQILFIEKQYKYGINLQERKDAVIEIISQQGKLTPEIEADIRACSKLSQVEDLYRPYKEKKKTRAGMAIKKGLQPLAQWLLDLSQSRDGDVRAKAEEFLSDQVETWQEALQGAEDIIAEQVSDDAKLRWSFKEHINKHGSLVTSKKKDAEDPKKTYEMYYDRTEAVTSLADHRIMAINRAEKEKVITVSFSYDRDSLSLKACHSLLGQYTPDSLELPAFPGDEDTISPVTEISRAAADGCKRLLFPSIENEIRRDLTDRACASSIEVFSSNLESLLSQPPIKGRVVLAFDPGYANGCKLAVLDETGKMLTVDKIFPFKGKGGLESSKERLLQLIRKYDVKIVAIGNGTASRESESLVSDLIKENNLDLSYAIVSEAGASVWSAQEDARKEFPDMPVEERSAVSIGRRLLDPLPELIKIDPRSIGVGQYQHDLPEKALTERLDEATMKVVNRVGADLNTASPALL